MIAPIRQGYYELKAIASTAASGALGVVLGILNTFVANPDGFLGPQVPGWGQFLVLTLGPPLAAAVAGYLAPHTDRPDLRGVTRTHNPLSPRN